MKNKNYKYILKEKKSSDELVYSNRNHDITISCHNFFMNPKERRFAYNM